MGKAKIFFLICLLILSFTACGEIKESENELIVPDIIDTDEDTAKDILLSSDLIPNIKYENSNYVLQGNVIKTVPKVGTAVTKNTKVVIYVSKGPSLIVSSDARMEWYGNQDDWQFHAPYIENGILYIECTVAFGYNMEWQDRYNEGKIIGIASVNDTFDKVVPVSASYEKKSWKKGESQSFTLEIPLTDLNVSQPTDMYIALYTENNGDVQINFYMTWNQKAISTTGTLPIEYY